MSPRYHVTDGAGLPLREVQVKFTLLFSLTVVIVGEDMVGLPGTKRKKKKIRI